MNMELNTDLGGQLPGVFGSDYERPWKIKLPDRTIESRLQTLAL